MVDVVDTTVEVKVVADKNRGERGVVGEATAALKLKKLWAESGKKIPLKRFARQLALSGDKLAKEWFASKNGLMNKGRSEKNQARANLERAASKQARRKKSQKPSTKASTDTPAT